MAKHKLVLASTGEELIPAEIVKYGVGTGLLRESYVSDLTKIFDEILPGLATPDLGDFHRILDLNPGMQIFVHRKDTNYWVKAQLVDVEEDE